MPTDTAQFEIIRADRLGFDPGAGMSSVFVEGFAKWLGFFSKDRDVLVSAFAHMFVPDRFYAAVTDGQIAGIAACAARGAESIRLDAGELRKHFGFLKGTIAAHALRKEFGRPFVNLPPQTGLIDFVGTALAFRGKGAASQIIRHILSDTPYAQYRLQVADTNTNAVNLYRKLGFEEFRRVPLPARKARRAGINSVIWMKYVKIAAKESSAAFYGPD